MPLAALGVFILWFGWFGFNPGSTTTADTSIARIAVNTNLSAAASAVMVMRVTWMGLKNPDVGPTMNGRWPVSQPLLHPVPMCRL
jgi:Amt family ammonium transporter